MSMSDEVKLLPCPTCHATSKDDLSFCSDGWHAKGPLYWPCEHCAGTGNPHTRPPIGTDEVVERVARAIARASDAPHPRDWNCWATIAKERLRSMARSAIAAMKDAASD